MEVACAPAVAYRAAACVASAFNGPGFVLVAFNALAFALVASNAPASATEVFATWRSVQARRSVPAISVHEQAETWVGRVGLTLVGRVLA